MSNGRTNWREAPLTEVLDFREGPGIMARDFRDEGVPLLRLAGLKRGASLLDGCNFLEEGMVSSRWNHFRVHVGDVLLSTSATLGEVAVVDESAAGAIPYTGIIAFRPKNDAILPEYIQFALTAPSFKSQIEAIGVGSVMRHFGPTHLKRMVISLPSRHLQGAISGVLGALDDKIAVNARIAASTDDLRRCLLEDFLATSPEQVIEAPLSSFADFVNGRAFTRGATGTGRMVVRIAELNSGPGQSTVYNDIEVADEHVARPGDVLFSWSGSLTAVRWFRPEAIVNQHIFKVIPRRNIPMWLVFELIQRKLPEFQAIAAGKATTMGHIQRRHLDEPVASPVEGAIPTLDTQLEPLWNRALEAEQESLALAELRDALLPGLMSGEIRVRDAEKVVEDVT